MDLEMAYAPPYSSAKDPVNMAGFVAENVLKGIMKLRNPMELDALIKEGNVNVLDIREKLLFLNLYIEYYSVKRKKRSDRFLCRPFITRI